MVLAFELRANLLVFERLFRLQSQVRTRFHAGLIGLGPVDYSDRIIRLRIVGIQFRSLAVVLLGLFKLLHLQIQIRDSLNAVYLLFVTGMAVQNLLILLDSSFSVAIIFRSVHPGVGLFAICVSPIHPVLLPGSFVLRGS